MKAALVAALCGVVASLAHGAEWKYENETDRMTGKRKAFAIALSDNNLTLAFPYQGKNYGQITVGDVPGQGTNVLLQIVKGQIMCHTYQCSIRAKFDDAPPTSFGGDHPADNSSNAVFLSNPKRFIEKARLAKKILIEFTAYNQGTQILEFTFAQPLAWPPKR